jgi:hypothetical protein
MKLSIHMVQQTKKDGNVVRQVSTMFSAGKDSGVFRKNLFSKQDPRLRKIKRAQNLIRTLHRTYTLPWNDNGQRLLPQKLYWNYTERMNKAIHDFESAVSDFVDHYPATIQQAKDSLGSLFNESDYMTAEEVRRGFSVTVTPMPVPASGHFVIDLGNGENARVRSEITRGVEQATARAVSSVWDRILSEVKHMQEALQEYGKSYKNAKGDKRFRTFRDSVVGNIESLLDILPDLNITDDPKLNEMIEDLRKGLVKYDADALRESATARSETLVNAQNILAKMQAYTGGN